MMLIKKDDFIHQTLAGAAIACLFIAFWVGKSAILGFIVFGLLFCIQNLSATIAAIRTNYLLFLFPLWAAITVFWADYPMLAIRHDIQLVLTFVLFISITCVAPQERILDILCFFFLLLLLSVLTSSKTVSIHQTGEVVRVGLLGSKNNVSVVGISAMAAGAMLLSSKDLPKIRIGLSVITIIVALATTVQARSLGTFIFLFVCGGAGLLLLNLQAIVKSRKFRKVVVWAGIVSPVLLIFCAFLFFSYQDYASFMNAIGKDPTLTGRTFIWTIGLKVIEDNFWGGVGLNSFWSEHNANAVLIWINSSRDVGVPFGFHNLYIHTWVETGFPGFLIMTAIIVKLLIRIVEIGRVGASPREAAAAAFALFIVLKSFLEVPIFGTFSINTFFFFFVWSVLNDTNISQKKSVSLPYKQKLYA